ncbi:MAG: ABC transporter permease [Actinomycetaceae bacterium]|nr:ABC transporter permease [Actinomycetaceae bacterium]
MSSLLNSNIVERISSLHDVESVWGYGDAFDVHNAAVNNSANAGISFVTPCENLPIHLIYGRMPVNEHEVILSSESYRRLGFAESGGVVENSSGQRWAVVGFYEPLHSQAPDVGIVFQAKHMELDSLNVTVSRVDILDGLIRDVKNIFGLSGEKSVQIEKNGTTQKLGSDVMGSQVIHTSRLMYVTISVVLVLLIFLSIMMVNSRKEEFGRRRVLGARRSTIFILLSMQTFFITTLASALASIVSLMVAFVLYSNGILEISFILSVNYLIVFSSIVVQLPSFASAVLRNPVLVLRTP